MAKKPSLLSGTLPTLQETGKPITDATANIDSLKGQYYPGTLGVFRDTMGAIAERAYKSRQTSDMKTLGGYMDPTKVSGGQFSNILGWVEGNRGRDISDMYGESMRAYTKTQELIGDDIKYFTDLRDKMKTNLQEFRATLAKDFPGVYQNMSSKERQDLEDGNIPDTLYDKMDEWSKDVYDRKLQWERDDRAMAKTIHDLDVAYKQAQTDEIRAEIAEKQKVVGGATDKMTELRESLAKKRQSFSDLEVKTQEQMDMGDYEGSGYSAGSALTKPYNSPEDVAAAILEWTDWAGDNLSPETVEAGINSLYYSLAPQSRPVSTGIETAEHKMEMEDSAEVNTAVNKVVNYFRTEMEGKGNMTEEDISYQDIVDLINQLKKENPEMASDIYAQMGILGYDFFD